jgi:glycine oxidase
MPSGWVDQPVWDLDEARARLDPGPPERLDRTPDVLVVGGGVVGLATAALCRRAGLGRVLLVERGRLAGGPSGRGEGIMRPEPRSWDGPPPPGFTAFARNSLALWRALDREWDGALEVTPYDWFLPETEAGEETVAAPPGALRLGAAEALAVEPLLPPGSSGLLVRGQAKVHPVRLAAALAARAGSVATGVAVTALEPGTGSGGGTVRTSHGDLHPGAVVLATGMPPHLPGLRPLPGRLVKGHLIATVPASFRLRIGLAARGGMVLQLADGRLVFGAAVGAAEVDDPSPEVRPKVVDAVHARLRSALPAAEGLPLSHAWACHRPATGDGEVPVIDRVEELGAVWATYGHFRTGFLLAAGTGSAIAQWIGGGAPPASVEPFRIAREVP